MVQLTLSASAIVTETSTVKPDGGYLSVHSALVFSEDLKIFKIQNFKTRRHN
jgi:hypothetical protein